MSEINILNINFSFKYKNIQFWLVLLKTFTQSLIKCIMFSECSIILFLYYNNYKEYNLNSENMNIDTFKSNIISFVYIILNSRTLYLDFEMIIHGDVPSLKENDIKNW